MLRYYVDDVFKCFVIVFALAAAILIHAFYANFRRADDDPKKQNFHPLSILLAPLTVPFFLILSIMTFIFTAVLYAGFILFFAVMILAVRKPFLFQWWDKFATAVGTPLLNLASSMIGLAVKPVKNKTDSMPENSPIRNL